MNLATVQQIMPDVMRVNLKNKNGKETLHKKNIAIYAIENGIKAACNKHKITTHTVKGYLKTYKKGDY